MKSDSKVIYYLHPYTYQFLKHSKKLDTLRTYLKQPSTSLEDDECIFSDFFKFEAIFCRHLPLSFVRGEIAEDIGISIPDHFLNMELPEEIRYINIFFEIIANLETPRYKHEPNTERLLFSAEKLSLLPIELEIKKQLFHKLCDCILSEEQLQSTLLSLLFYYDVKNRNNDVFQLMENK